MAWPLRERLEGSPVGRLRELPRGSRSHSAFALAHRLADPPKPSQEKPSSRKKNAKKAKWFSEEPLQIAEKRREAKGKSEKERYIHFNTKLQRIARRLGRLPQ